MGVNLTSHALIGEYTRAIAFKNFSKFTIEKYKTLIEKFIAWLWEEKGIRALKDVTKEVLSDFQNKLHTQKRLRDNLPLSSATKAKHILALKSFFRFLAKGGFIPYNPASELEVPRTNPDRLRSVLDEKEIKRFLESIKGKTPLEVRDRAIFEVFYSTGIRNSELRSLETGDVDFKRQALTVRHAKGFLGERQRIVPIGKIALGWVWEYLEKARPKLIQESTNIATLFVNLWGGPLEVSIPSKLAGEYSRKAGLKKKVTPHVLRHSFAVHLLKHGADIRFVQEMLGHASLDATKLYTKLEISDLKAIHRKCHPRER